MTQEQIGYIQNLWNDIVQAGEELRDKPMPRLRKEDFFLFKETGNRLVYEGEYFGRRKYLTVFGILAEFGRKSEDIRMLAQVMEEICEEKFWALPAHVNFNALDEKTIDLFAAETAQSLMEIVDILGDKLPSGTVERVVREVTERVIAPFVKSEVPYSWWETDRCNWSAVCAGSLGMAAIYLKRLLKRHGQAMAKLPPDWNQSIITRTCNALQCYLDGMEEDGACTEGLGYYSYGMSYYTAFAQLLYRETQGETDLMRMPKCEQIALFQQKCYFGGGVSVSFSDGSDKENFLPGLTAFLKSCYPHVVMPDMSLARPLDADACYRWLTNERNIRWMLQYEDNLEYEEGSPKEHRHWNDYLLPAAQWMICTDPDGNGYAAKGGHNDENHNHNDIGHFLCVYKGEMLLADLGAGEYTKEYFSDGRYEILCNRSLGHSVPIVNGQEQCAGRRYAADIFDWNEEKKELTISFAKAYPQGSIDTLTRKITSDSQGEEYTMQVTDTFILSKDTGEIVENLVTTYPPVVQGNQIHIRGSKSTMLIEVSSMAAGTGIKVVHKIHSNHEGKPQDVYLLQWKLPLPQKNAVNSEEHETVQIISAMGITCI